MDDKTLNNLIDLLLITRLHAKFKGYNQQTLEEAKEIADDKGFSMKLRYWVLQHIFIAKENNLVIPMNIKIYRILFNKVTQLLKSKSLEETKAELLNNLK